MQHTVTPLLLLLFLAVASPGQSTRKPNKNFNGENVVYEGTKQVKSPGYLTEQFSNRAVKFIKQQKAKPLFLYLTYNAVHWPFQAPGSSVRTRENWHDGDRAEYGLTQQITRNNALQKCAPACRRWFP